jgi:predicted DNA-binding transcriptional regulator YafY
MSSESDEKPWRFVTSHTQVLLCIARSPEIRIRDLADLIGITERAAQRIIADLVEAGYVERTRVGRRNRYVVNPRHKMRHPLQQTHEIGELLDLLAHAEPAGTPDDSELTKRRAQRADAASKDERSRKDGELAS